MFQSYFYQGLTDPLEFTIIYYTCTRRSQNQEQNICKENLKVIYGNYPFCPTTNND